MEDSGGNFWKIVGVLVLVVHSVGRIGLKTLVSSFVYKPGMSDIS